ncbi:MAG: serine protein kinase RIO [Candidatus Heimdallarchaeota archaeon]|nr:serine protein kinase RIO [Candidatus Heimdallarchaeota archaeon]
MPVQNSNEKTPPPIKREKKNKEEYSPDSPGNDNNSSNENEDTDENELLEDELTDDELLEEEIISFDEEEDPQIEHGYHNADTLQKRRIDQKKRKTKDSDELKVAESVLDVETRTTLFQLRTRDVIDYITGVISTGKEANIYHGFAPDGQELAIKVYRTSTHFFKRFQIYIIGDPRFKKLRRDRRAFVHTWAKKEFKNLKRATSAGVSVPKPIVNLNDVVVMEFIGEKSLPYRIMKEEEIIEPEETYEEVLVNLKKLYNDAKLVHADLSEYNIMYTPKVYFIDFAQAVLLDHPYAEIFLYRDLQNITRYFYTIDVEVIEPDELFEELVGEYPSSNVKAFERV